MNKQSLIKNNYSKQSGLTLIEVLVSVIVLSIGILGMLALQTTGMRTNQSSFYRTQAVVLAYDFIDRMRANPNGVVGGFYDSVDSNSSPTAPGCMTTGCNAQDRATLDIAQWSENFDANTGILPDGRGRVSVETDDTFTVNITWSETDWDDDNVGKKVLETKSVNIVARPHFE